MAELLDRQSVLEALDRKSGRGSYADIPPGSSPSPVMEALGLADPQRESRIKNLKRDQLVIHKAYDAALTGKVKKLFEEPTTLGEAEGILGKGAVGRLPSQIDMPQSFRGATTAGGMPLNLTPEEGQNLMAREPDFQRAGFAPLDLTSMALNPNAPMSPLQTATFEPMVKEMSQLAFAPKQPVKHGGWLLAFEPQTGAAAPVAGAPEEKPGPESPMGKLLADRDKYDPVKNPAEWNALDLAAKLINAPLDSLVTLDANGKPVLNQTLVDAKAKIAEAGAQKNITNIQNYTPAGVKFQEQFAESTRVTYDKLKTVPAQIQNLRAAKQLIIPGKGFMGTGGETLLDAAKFLNNRLGFSINPEGIVNAETLRSRLFFNIMDNLKKVDAQPSQMQQIIMQDSLGRLSNDPLALPHIIDAYISDLTNKVNLYNEEVQGAQKINPKFFPYDPVIKIPLTDEQKAQRILEIRNQKRGR